MMNPTTEKEETQTVEEKDKDSTGYQSFPLKLYELLSDPEKQEFIAWKEHGLAFEILQPKQLVKEILPVVFNRKYFK